MNQIKSLTKNYIKYISSLQQKKYRKQYNVFLAEGKKIVKDIQSTGFEINAIIATSKYLQSNADNLENIENIFEATPEQINKVSTLKTPQNAIAVVSIPNYELDVNEISSTLSILLDDVRDPGNLGTIIRIADWFGINNIVCSPKSVDVYNPKVVQASMGSLARVKIYYLDLVIFLQELSLSIDFPVYGTFPEGPSIYDEKLSEKGIIILGNESVGITPNLEPFINRKISIPSYPGTGDVVDSLNISTAAAIVCSEFRRRMV